MPPLNDSNPLPKEFYKRSPDHVAVDLIGRIIMSRVLGVEKSCVIVETEAYHGPWDPASRASMHRRGRIVERLRGAVGVTLVYGIHRQWLLNVVAHPPAGWGAVLLRACEPLSPGQPPPRGPGRLTRYLSVDRRLDGVPVYDPKSLLLVLEARIDGVRITRGWRVGVRRDMPLKQRFCLEGTVGLVLRVFSISWALARPSAAQVS